MTDRWKCPDCGKITVDAFAPLAACRCGSERVQMREWVNDDDESWQQPDWPEDSEFSPDPYDVETEIEFESKFSADPDWERIP